MRSTGNKRPTPGSSATLARFSSSRRSMPPSANAPLVRSAARCTTRTRTRTTTARTFTGAEDACIIAIIDNSQREVGFCAYNLRSFDVQLRQFPDSSVYSKLITALCVFAPVEIILSLSSADSMLDYAIQACVHLQHVKRTFTSRIYFNETNGALVVSKLSIKPCPHLARLGESACYLALATCGALIRYVEHVYDKSFFPLSLRIRFRRNDSAMFLDMAALESLEVVANAFGSRDIHGPNLNTCLLSVIDNTTTRPGKRFLRSVLLEPSADLLTIQMRQEAVDEISNAEEMYFALVQALGSFPDLERALAALMAREHTKLRSKRGGQGVREKAQHVSSSQAEERSHDGSDDESHFAARIMLGRDVNAASPPSMALVQNVIMIKTAIETIPHILTALQQAESPLLRAFVDCFRDPASVELLKDIEQVIESKATVSKEPTKMRMQAAFAVREGRDGRLDITRRILEENIDDMKALTEEIRQKYGLHKLDLNYQQKRGYHFTLHKKYLNINDIPDEFIQVDARKKIYRFSCEELERLNLRYQHSLHQIWWLTELQLGDLLNKIFATDVLLALYQICDAIAVLDCLMSFVGYISNCETETKMPKLTEGGPIGLKQAYHPILLELDARSTIPNDIFLDETSALHIISGPNGAGKSVYMQSIGLVVLLAHTGCPVPAKFATVRILNRIATKMNNADDVSQSESHFSKEMKDIASILGSITNDPQRCSGSQRRVTTGSPDDNNNNGNMLVLIDELGRSTSTIDGFAIAYAIAETLAASPGILTLFTTHFLALGALASVNPVVKNFHFRTVTENERTTDTNTASVQNENHDDSVPKFNYKVEKGVLQIGQYGGAMARLAGFPVAVVQDARRMANDVPTRLIGSAAEFEEKHLQLSEPEKLQLRKMKSVVGIVSKLNVIEASNANATRKIQLRKDLRDKLRVRRQSGHESRTTIAQNTNVAETRYGNNTEQQTEGLA